MKILAVIEIIAGVIIRTIVGIIIGIIAGITTGIIIETVTKACTARQLVKNAEESWNSWIYCMQGECIEFPGSV